MRDFLLRRQFLRFIEKHVELELGRKVRETSVTEGLSADKAGRTWASKRGYIL